MEREDLRLFRVVGQTEVEAEICKNLQGLMDVGVICDETHVICIAPVGRGAGIVLWSRVGVEDGVTQGDPMLIEFSEEGVDVQKEEQGRERAPLSEALEGVLEGEWCETRS